MASIDLREPLLHREPNVFKGLAAGTIGGLVASWVMDEFQYAWFKIGRSLPQAEDSETPGAEQSQNSAEPATVKAAEMVSQKIFGHELAKNGKAAAGTAVHYVTGGTLGAVYGVAAELAPEVTIGAGIPFGTAVWLVVDEAAVAVLGLSKGPTEYPLSTHIYALASHFVYGLTTEVVRRALRKTILS